MIFFSFPMFAPAVVVSSVVLSESFQQSLLFGWTSNFAPAVVVSSVFLSKSLVVTCSLGLCEHAIHMRLGVAAQAGQGRQGLAGLRRAGSARPSYFRPT